MDIDGSKFVTISNVVGDSDDDGITVKSTSPLISENITITNCVISSHCNGIKFGTESTGGFRNVVVSNCVIKPSRQLTTIYGKPAGISGISLEMVDGGIMENIAIDNIVIDGPLVPLFMRLGNRARKYIADAPAPGAGIARHITISNIEARGADETGCSFSGLEKSFIEDITLRNISIETNGGGTGNNIDAVVPEKETDYPEATVFGKLPSYGIYIRYAKNIRLSNINIHSRGLDNRPGIRIDKTNLFSLSGMDLQSLENKDAAIYITNSSNGVIHNSIKRYPFRHYLLKDKNSVNIVND
jgi:polygalacturonase